MGQAIVGRPKSAASRFYCEYEEIIIPFCNIGPDDVDVVHTVAEIEALINASGETFNSDGAVVDLNDPDQTLFWADVTTYFCDSVLKGKGVDGADYTVFNDGTCITNAAGDVIFQLFQGGTYALGDSDLDPDTAVVIDESVVWPCGSGGRYCVKVKRTLDAVAVTKAKLAAESTGGGGLVQDFTTTFKSAGLNTIVTDKGTITIPAADSAFDSTGADATTWANAQAQIQAFLDANGGGTVAISYPSQSILQIDITGTECVIISADHTSNPGPHPFTVV